MAAYSKEVPSGKALAILAEMDATAERPAVRAARILLLLRSPSWDWSMEEELVHVLEMDGAFAYHVEIAVITRKNLSDTLRLYELMKARQLAPIGLMYELRHLNDLRHANPGFGQ
jgi:hypothetical protein